MKGKCQHCDEEYSIDGLCERCERQWERCKDEAAWEDVRKERLEEPRPFPSREDCINNYDPDNMENGGP